MTAIDKANAVVDGFAGETTLIGRNRWYWPVSVTLKNDVRNEILRMADPYAGVNPRLIGLSGISCCDRRRVIVHTFSEGVAACFSPRVRTILHVCSVCGNIHRQQ